MEKYYRSNFSKFFLLTNDTIRTSFPKYTIEIKSPNVKELFFNEDFILFLNSLTNASDFWTSNGLFKANSELEVVIGMYKYAAESRFISSFTYCFPNLVLQQNKIYCDDVEVTQEDFSVACRMLLVANNLLSFEEFENGSKKEDLDDELSAFKKRQKELEDKIRGIKKSSSSQRMEDNLVFILNAFPQFTIESIMELNYFSFMHFLGWAYRIIAQRVQDIAAGNGLAKQYTTLFDEVKK